MNEAVRGSRGSGFVVVLAFGFFVPLSARASPVFELAGAVQGNGGLNARVVESGAASTYFNPALLPDAEEGYDLGVFMLGEQIGIRDFARPAGADLPVGSENAEVPGGGRFPRYGIPTQWLEKGKPADPPDEPLRARPRQASGTGRDTRLYQVLGIVQKYFGGQLALGAYAMIPYGKFTGASAFYSDEREQYFSNSLHAELYDDRLTATSIAFGLGWRPHPVISVGIGATLSLTTIATTPTFLSDVGHFQQINVDSNVDVSVALSPHFGVTVTPVKQLRLAATVHTPQKLDIGTNFTFLLSNGLEQSSKVSFTHDYLPWQFGLGGAWDMFRVGGTPITLAATVVHARWSGYVDRHSEHPDGAYRWYDTFTGTAGLRYAPGALHTLLDVTYVPSPVPDQVGRTNYVDNDRIGVSGGADYGVPFLDGTLRFGAQAQLHRLIPRETRKQAGVADPVVDELPDDSVINSKPVAGSAGLQTNNPGWPGYASNGWIIGAGAYLRYTR